MRAAGFVKFCFPICIKLARLPVELVYCKFIYDSVDDLYSLQKSSTDKIVIIDQFDVNILFCQLFTKISVALKEAVTGEHLTKWDVSMTVSCICGMSPFSETFSACRNSPRSSYLAWSRLRISESICATRGGQQIRLHQMKTKVLQKAYLDHWN